MTVADVFCMKLFRALYDVLTIYVRGERFEILASGTYGDPHLFFYLYWRIDSFTYEPDDHILYIDVNTDKEDPTW